MSSLFTDDMDMEFAVRHKKCGMNAEDLVNAAGVVTNVKEVYRHLKQDSFNFRVAFEFQQMLNYMKRVQGWTFDKEAHWEKVISQLQRAAAM